MYGSRRGTDETIIGDFDGVYRVTALRVRGKRRFRLCADFGVSVELRAKRPRRATVLCVFMGRLLIKKKN